MESLVSVAVANHQIPERTRQVLRNIEDDGPIDGLVLDCDVERLHQHLVSLQENLKLALIRHRKRKMDVHGLELDEVIPEIFVFIQNVVQTYFENEVHGQAILEALKEIYHDQLDMGIASPNISIQKYLYLILKSSDKTTLAVFTNSITIMDNCTAKINLGVYICDFEII